VTPAPPGSIIAWREQRGPFEAVEDLQYVPEVGPAVMRQVRGHLKV
jgi:DNA uptake protein ComE-like DNA-binding protein